MSTASLDSKLVTRIGQYRVLTRLSVGGMAEIFLAVAPRERGGELCTLKRILPELREREEFVRMFLDEARISVSLAHPNIARIFELRQEGTDLYLAMEYIPGESLADILRACRKASRPVPLGFAGMIARDACEALQYAHDFALSDGLPAPIVHRDISPSNIMVTYDGTVKVIDFGVAKAAGSLSRTGGGMIKGSCGYMSPEQARGAPLDARSDVFSTGVVLHELLTGRPLFLRDSELLTFRGILRDEIPPPIRVNPGVPPMLSSAVMRALARSVAERCTSADQLARDIETAIPSLLFDPERARALMHELFGERARIARAMLELDPLADGHRLQAAAESLREGPASALTPEPTGRTDIYGPLPTGVMYLSSVAPEQPPPEIEARAVEGAIVLSVDDSEISREFIEAHLEGSGFPVLSRGSAEEALRVLEHQLPDLILLDVRMPGIDGYELCRQIRRRTTRRPYLPILFLTAANSFEERLEGIAAGGNDFIHKPYNPEQLIGLVRTHLQRAAFLEQLSLSQRAPPPSRS